jgi:HK97 gp10 family phage protein
MAGMTFAFTVTVPATPIHNAAKRQAILTEESARAVNTLTAFMRTEARAQAVVRTGRMRSSVTAESEDGTGEVLASGRVFADEEIAPYAAFVERGTSRMRAQPYFAPAQARAESVAPGVGQAAAARIAARLQGGG